MRVLHAYNPHRGGGGANRATEATISISRLKGIEIEVCARSPADAGAGLASKAKVAWGALTGGASVRSFAQTLDRFRPDVVHIHEIFPMISPWILPECARRRIPVVMSCVDYRMTCPVVTHFSAGEICNRCAGGREYHAVLRNCRGNLPESLTMGLYSLMVRHFRLLLDNVAQFIAPSEFTRDWLVRHAGISPKRISAISPLVDLAEAATDPAEGTYIAYAGRFSAEKGVGLIAEAAQLAKAPFRLARQKESLVTLSPPASLPSLTTGNRAELNDFYRGARAVIVPSLWFESFGLVAAEAMSHGLPVLISRTGALENLVEDTVDGLLFERGNAAELAEKADLLWNDPALARRLGKAAREKALRSWSADVHFDRLAEIYTRATQSSDPDTTPNGAAPE